MDSKAKAKISFVTCVNDFSTYDKCVVSSFTEDECQMPHELLPIDNTSNLLSASEALNYGLKQANGQIVVFCHQGGVIDVSRFFSNLFFCLVLMGLSR